MSLTSPETPRKVTDVPKVDHKENAHIDVITFRTDRHDLYYRYPIEGVVTGTSVSHIASRITFNVSDLKDDPKLLAELRSLNKITGENIFLEKADGKCELYFSFWPAKGWDPISKSSQLRSHAFDTKMSNEGTPMPMHSKYASTIGMDKKVISSFLPIPKIFSRQEITLAPSVIVNLSRIEKAYGKDAADAAGEYAKAYEKNNDAELALNNYQHNLVPKKGTVLKLENDIEETTEAQRLALLELKKQINIGAEKTGNEAIKKDDSNLMYILEKYFTFGTPERDSTSLPLVTGSDKNGLGLQLKPMLEFACDVAKNPTKYPYNVAEYNCANLVHTLLRKGVDNGTNHRVRDALALPLFAEYTAMPVVPGMVLEKAIHAGEVINREKNQGDERFKFIKDGFYEIEHLPLRLLKDAGYGLKHGFALASVRLMSLSSMLHKDEDEKKNAPLEEILHGVLSLQDSIYKGLPFDQGLFNQIPQILSTYPLSPEKELSPELKEAGLFVITTSIKLALAAAEGAVKGTISGGVVNPPEKLAANAIAGASLETANELARIVGAGPEVTDAINLAKVVYNTAANGKPLDKEDGQLFLKNLKNAQNKLESLESSLGASASPAAAASAGGGPSGP